MVVGEHDVGRALARVRSQVAEVAARRLSRHRSVCLTEDGQLIGDGEGRWLRGRGGLLEVNRALEADSGASWCLSGELLTKRMFSCWPRSCRGYGIQARIVSPAGTASASTVMD